MAFRYRQRIGHTPLRRRIANVSAALMLVVAGAAVAAQQAPVAGALTSTSEQKSRDVTVDAEVGLDGVVPVAESVPLRVLLTSTRARSVRLELSWDSGRRVINVELGADAPTRVDLSLPPTAFLDLNVTTSGGDPLANKTVAIDIDSSKTLIGVGKAAASQGAPRTSPTIGSIQTATLVGLNAEMFRRPGALESMSGVVLSAADLDALGGDEQAALKDWVWAGGDLALDVAQREQLPVLDLPSDGLITAVGAGWVRFTDGAAAAGQWSSILEPSVVRTSDSFNNGLDGMGFGGDIWSGGIQQSSLLEVGFIPTWVIVLAVFGTALVAGPLAWFVLHSRRRRRWMWFTAPAISLAVAGVLLVSGQGVFASAKTKMVAEVRSSPWGSSGSVISGLKESTTINLEGGAELTNSTPSAVVTSSGDRQTVRIDLPRNSFGNVAISGVGLDDGPRIEVVAVATPDGKADVSVTNRSEGILRNVMISGNGRSRNFAEVGPNQTETLPFEMSSDIWVFTDMFPDEGAFDQNTGSPLLPTSGGIPESRGLVRIAGTVETPISTAGMSGDGTVKISSVVPVQGATAEPATLRIDELGGWSNQQLEQRRANGQMFNDPDNFDNFDDFDGGMSGVTTTAVPAPVPGNDPGSVGPGFGEGQGPGLEAPITSSEFVRLSFPDGRSAGPCGMHTLAPTLSAWDGQAWTPLEKTGGPYLDERLKDIQGQPSEMQEWLFPAVEPGGRLHLRIDGRQFFSPPALLFDCAARP